MLENYLKNIGLNNLVLQINKFTLNDLVNETFLASFPVLSREEVQNLFIYDVPKMSADGTCSILEEKADKPYSLIETFGLDADWKSLKNHKQTIRLWRLKQIVNQIYKQSQVEWFGIYRKVHKDILDSRLRGNDKDKDSFLVKESYQGVFTRAEFPLTKDFAKKSNNSTVGLSGKAIVIADVAAHNGAYYECDGKVNSEFCLPILGLDDEIIGIIDAEAFAKNHYSAERLLHIAKVAYDLGQINLGL